MTQTKCKTCWKCGIPVLPLVSLCYHCVPLWYPCGTTGIPPKTQPPLFDDLALRHCWPRTDKCSKHIQSNMHTLHIFAMSVLCNCTRTCLMSSSLGIFASTQTLVETQTPLLDNLAGPQSLLVVETCIVRGRVHIKLCFHLSIWINLTNVGHIQSPNPKQCTELPEVLIIPQLLHKRQTDTPLVIFECLA